VYHAVQGDTQFLGEGLVRILYFFILISHIGVTVFALPLILSTFYLAATKQFERHKKFARITFPLWLYVSVTGVAIYFLLKAHSQVGLG
jgi:putative membrane protein